MYFLLTAPHPDDDVCGLGDFVQHLPQDTTVGVWFMTDGNQANRRVEATKALNLLGVTDIFWKTLPFYRRADRKWDEEDVRVAHQMLSALNPDQLAVCFDADPHRTHTTCATVLQQAARIGLHASNIKDVLLYHSAWANTTVYRNIVPDEVEKTTWVVRNPSLKEQALRCHESQLTLTTHDGMGNSLLARGNLQHETYYTVPFSKFPLLSVCVPNLQRRTTYTSDVGQYVVDTYLKDLPDGSRVIFPTGNTPLKMYQVLRNRDGHGCFQVYQLDEYVGSTEYSDYLKRELPSRYSLHCIDGKATDLEEECARHDRACQQVDLCILGIGKNGHVGFNEPPSNEASPTRVVQLDPSTVEANQTPHTHAITLGIRTILTSKKIVVMAHRNKHAVLQEVYAGRTPAACLAHHPHVELVVESPP